MRTVEDGKRVAHTLREPAVQGESIGEPAVGHVASCARNLAIARKIWVKKERLPEHRSLRVIGEAIRRVRWKRARKSHLSHKLDLRTRQLHGRLARSEQQQR